MPVFEVKVAEVRTRYVRGTTLKDVQARLRAQQQRHTGTRTEFFVLSLEELDADPTIPDPLPPEAA